MRPLLDDRAVKIVREAVPEFDGSFLDLLDAYDDDLTPQVVFNEFAGFVGELMRERTRPDLLRRCFNALEGVTVTPGVDTIELVAFCFLDHLPSFAFEEARELCGPQTAILLQRLEEDLLFEDDEDDDADDADGLDEPTAIDEGDRFGTPPAR